VSIDYWQLTVKVVVAFLSVDFGSDIVVGGFGGQLVIMTSLQYLKIDKIHKVDLNTYKQYRQAELLDTPWVNSKMVFSRLIRNTHEAFTRPRTVPNLNHTTHRQNNNGLYMSPLYHTAWSRTETTLQLPGTARSYNTGRPADMVAQQFIRTTVHKLNIHNTELIHKRLIHKQLKVITE